MHFSFTSTSLNSLCALLFLITLPHGHQHHPHEKSVPFRFFPAMGAIFQFSSPPNTALNCASATTLENVTRVPYRVLAKATLTHERWGCSFSSRKPISRYTRSLVGWGPRRRRRRRRWRQFLLKQSPPVRSAGSYVLKPLTKGTVCTEFCTQGECTTERMSGSTKWN